MPRRRRPETREILPDPMYNSTLAEKFVNSMMWDGKKTVSQRIFYDAMDRIKESSQDDPLKLFKKAVENCKPLLEVKTRRVGGANYQVPVEVPQQPAHQPGDSLDSAERPEPAGKEHAGEAGERIERRCQLARRSDQEERRCPSHGRSKQGFCALSLVKENCWSL